MRLGIIFLALSCATLESSRTSALCKKRYDACVNACPGVSMSSQPLNPAAAPGQTEPEPSTRPWRVDRNESPLVDCVYECRSRRCD